MSTNLLPAIAAHYSVDLDDLVTLHERAVALDGDPVRAVGIVDDWLRRYPGADADPLLRAARRSYAATHRTRPARRWHHRRRPRRRQPHAHASPTRATTEPRMGVSPG